MKYEYKIVNMLAFEGIKQGAPWQAQLKNELDRMGLDGWLLVDGTREHAIIFAREIK